MGGLWRCWGPWMGGLWICLGQSEMVHNVCGEGGSGGMEAVVGDAMC